MPRNFDKKAYDKKYKELNKDKAREQRRIYKKQNAEKIKEYNRIYQKQNEEKIKEYRRIYRSNPLNKKIANINAKERRLRNQIATREFYEGSPGPDNGSDNGLMTQLES